MQAQIITIGDEILIGQIVDTNSAWIAQQLNLHGIQVKEITSVSDASEHIVAAVRQAFDQIDLVLVTGGLGPTKDDITKNTLADYFGLEMAFHQATYDRIVNLLAKLGRTPTQAQYLQAFMPNGIKILTNQMGTAPGMWFEQAGKVLVSMPGVPYEMKYLMEHEVLPRLPQVFNTLPIRHRTVLTVGIGESLLAEKIEAWAEQLPPNVKLAYLPNIGRVRLRLTAMGKETSQLDNLLDEKVKQLTTLLTPYVYGYEKESFEVALGTLLKAKGVTVATAESCTGGFIAHKITSVSGSSAYFKGSVVAYDNAIKTSLLGVKKATLIEHGAVSEATVLEMVKGIKRIMKTDCGIAVSGIAGPTGGTPTKPVGTIWIAVANESEIRTKKLQLTKNRLKNIEYTSIYALNMLRQMFLLT